jgi:hypothetical protein
MKSLYLYSSRKNYTVIALRLLSIWCFILPTNNKFRFQRCKYGFLLGRYRWNIQFFIFGTEKYNSGFKVRLANIELDICW